MVIYSITIFTSAFLLFQVQPLIAKLILPWFGGSAAVWTTCMLFFQVLLLGGYVYAHQAMRLRSPVRQAMLHCALLAAALFTLPLAPGAGWKPAGSGGDPTWPILALLATSVGLPYFMLSSTGPLIQAWYARTHREAVPYRLFALSNAGSLLALLSYPLLVEPRLTARWQTWLWSGGFALFAVLCGLIVWRAARTAPAGPPAGEVGEAPPLALRVWWAALAACASILLLAFTSHLSQNVAPIPFLWVLPLALYLASFIVCFEAPRWYRRDPYLVVLALGLAGVCFTLWPGHRHPPLEVLIPLYCATLFCACMVCHGELARSKPHPAQLTGFYLMLALGGALGGLFVGLIAPRIFNDLYELPLGLAFLGAIACAALWRDPDSVLHGRFNRPARALLALLAGALITVLGMERMNRPLRSKAEVRNFYGVLDVYDSGLGDATVRGLKNGTILHGNQFLLPARRRWPTTYYGPDSGVGLAFASAGESRHLGVVGLGAGTLACYGKPGDVLRFYEINPQVIELARTQFTYLGDSGARVEMVLGDARLSLEREAPQGFDVLVLDAFSSDSIPVHLLTLEAFRIYQRHLKPDGILAVHVTNRYLKLTPVVAAAAQALQLEVRHVDDDDDKDTGISASDWLLLTANHRIFDTPALSEAEAVEVRPGLRPWTDDYSDLYGALK